MTKKIVFICVVLLLGVLSLGQKGKQDKKDISAYIVKVIRDVNMKSPAQGWQKALPLSTLKSGYEVKTEKGSLAKITFTDQSVLILREKSIVMIKGEVKGKEILSRSIHMDRGNMIFNVKKAETEQFRFSSPISVASIRGTLGGYISGGSADSLTIVEGLAEFTNSRTGKKGSVGAGQTGVADSSGNFNIGKASEQALNSIRQGQKMENELDQPSGIGPHFGQLKSNHAGTVRSDLSSLKGNAVAISLFCKKPSEQTFIEIPLTLTGQTASGQISAEKVKYPSLEYYLAITMKDGSIVVVPENGKTKPGTVAVEASKRELRIPGQTGTLQKKVIVLKWNE
jgi:hypothetical protein